MSDRLDKNYSQSVTVKVSRLAMIAISSAVCGSILVISGFMILREKTDSPTMRIHEILLIAGTGILFLALVTGIISLILIGISGGKKTGTNFSAGAIVMSILVGLLLAISLSLIKVRSMAFRMVCGMNLSEISKAMILYANDSEDKFPRAGGPGATLGTGIKWDASSRNEAFDISAAGNTASATVSSSLFMLMRYADITPKTFICKGDKGVSYFEPPRDVDITKLWDFGPQPWRHVSYAYQAPYGGYSLTAASDPGMAVLADRNPWMSWWNWKVQGFNIFDPLGAQRFQRVGNTPCHRYEGQNVLFLDSHVSFEKVSFCGVNKDNIYTIWNRNDISKGMQPPPGGKPAGRLDSLLVNDFPPIQK